MKETTPPKDPKKKLWIGYAVIIAILFACNLFLFPAMMQAKVKSVNYSTFLQMLENKQLSTVQIEDQQIYFVDNENNSYKTNAIAQDNNLVTRLEDAGVEFGTVYQSPTIWDSLLNLAISLLPMILLFWWLNRYIGKKMQSMGGANSMLFGGGKSGAKQYVVDDKTGIIEDAKFKTYGCGSAIASSSLVTEWVKGKTLDEAAALKNSEIAEELALPPVKIHCSILAEDAVKAAIADYRAKQAKKA